VYYVTAHYVTAHYVTAHYAVLHAFLIVERPSILKGGLTFVTLPRNVTPYRDSVDGTRGRVTYQKLVTRPRDRVTNF